MDLWWDPYIVPRDHPRYFSVTKCKYYPILGKYNYWLIINFTDKVTNEEDYEWVQKFVSDGYEKNTA